jgi:hypothetical protein
VKKTARQRINEFIKTGKVEMRTELKLDPEMKWCLAKAIVITADGQTFAGHKLMWRKDDADGQPDATFVGAAETMAIARAIGFFFGEEDMAQEEFDELLVFTIKRVNELYQSSTRSAKEYVNSILNDDLRQKATVYLETLLTKTAASFAVQSIEDGEND